MGLRATFRRRTTSTRPLPPRTPIIRCVRHPRTNTVLIQLQRKHNPHIITNSVAGLPDRALRVRNFNDFAVDVNASALPQHVWITPNLVNDAHDTDVTFVSEWLEYWLLPLLSNPNFNSNRTLIQLTFDESGACSDGRRGVS